MYSVIVNLEVREDAKEAFERIVTDLALAVRANEPDNLEYRVLRNRAEPSKYQIVEVYASKEAFKAHMAAAYTKSADPHVQNALASPGQLQVFEVVA